ncbi:PREDICTED: uncharacterized protein LOC101292904 [Fragaria vesca subsp. vesca]
MKAPCPLHTFLRSGPKIGGTTQARGRERSRSALYSKWEIHRLSHSSSHHCSRCEIPPLIASPHRLQILLKMKENLVTRGEGRDTLLIWHQLYVFHYLDVFL